MVTSWVESRNIQNLKTSDCSGLQDRRCHKEIVTANVTIPPLTKPACSETLPPFFQLMPWPNCAFSPITSPNTAATAERS
jgi:hypothetical protein